MNKKKQIKLSPEDQAAFAASLLNPPSPNQALDRAFELRAQLLGLTPMDQARVLLQSRIEILTNEAIATSAIEGINLNRAEVRRAILRRLAIEEDLLMDDIQVEVKAVRQARVMGQKEK